jgi:hypothetical protein
MLGCPPLVTKKVPLRVIIITIMELDVNLLQTSGAAIVEVDAARGDKIEEQVLYSILLSSFL